MLNVWLWPEFPQRKVNLTAAVLETAQVCTPTASTSCPRKDPESRCTKGEPTN